MTRLFIEQPLASPGSANKLLRTHQSTIAQLRQSRVQLQQDELALYLGHQQYPLLAHHAVTAKFRPQKLGERFPTYSSIRDDTDTKKHTRTLQVKI